MGERPSSGSPGEYVDRGIILSRALHAAAEPYIRTEWSRARRIIASNLARQRTHAHGPLAQKWTHEWERAAAQGPEAVIALSRLRGEHGNDLRQMTPLAGVLPYAIQRRIALELPR